MSETKPCTMCERDLPLGSYPPDARRDDGRASACHECAALRVAKWRARAKKNRAKQREWNRQYAARKRAEKKQAADPPRG